MTALQVGAPGERHFGTVKSVTHVDQGKVGCGRAFFRSLLDTAEDQHCFESIFMQGFRSSA